MRLLLGLRILLNDKGNNMKTITTIALIAACTAFSAPVSADQYLWPTLPGTTLRDYDAPGIVIQKSPYNSNQYGNNVFDTPTQQYNIYQTLPGTTLRDYSKPGWTTR